MPIDEMVAWNLECCEVVREFNAVEKKDDPPPANFRKRGDLWVPE